MVRAVLAAGFNLGNDEAYYYTYALYPALSHFDHPPMVGWVIQLFSANLYWSSEFFIRLAAVVAGTLNTWLMFQIGKQLRDELTGWYAALLYTASVYGFIMAGVFILPDAPQSVFWLSATLLLLKAFDAKYESSAGSRFMLASVFIGLGMLSKYTTAYLWVAMLLFVISYRRQWLGKVWFYLGHFIMAVLLLPVLIWNWQNQFVSFLFHSGRVQPGGGFTLNYFLTELLGEALYTNPVNLVLIGIALAALIKTRRTEIKPEIRFLLFAALPLVFTFLLVSVWRTTLPHWNAPGYLTLLPVVALWIRNSQQKLFPAAIKASLAVMIVVLTVSVIQILTGFIPVAKLTGKAETDPSGDFSLEIYGWSQLGTEFNRLAAGYESRGLMPAAAPIVSYRWFPAANYEYYVTRGTSRVVMATGDTAAIHKYIWINQLHGGFRLNTDAWYITSSRDFVSPRALPNLYYEKVLPPDTIAVTRMGKQVYAFYLYRMKNLQSKR